MGPSCWVKGQKCQLAILSWFGLKDIKLGRQKIIFLPGEKASFTAAYIDVLKQTI